MQALRSRGWVSQELRVALRDRTSALGSGDNRGCLGSSEGAGQAIGSPQASVLLVGPVCPPIPLLLILYHKVPQEAIEAGPGWGSLRWELPFQRGLMQPCGAKPAFQAWPSPYPPWGSQDLHAPHGHPGQAQLLAQGEVFQLQGMDFFLQALQQLLPGYLGAQGGDSEGSQQWYRAPCPQPLLYPVGQGPGGDPPCPAGVVQRAQCL